MSNKKNNPLSTVINKWDDKAQEIRKNIDSIENHLCNLRNQVLELKYKTEAAGEYASANIDDLMYGIETTSQVIQKKNKESQLSFPLLKEKAQNTSSSIGNIITHLQYHDIIRQKIEHVQESHMKIVEDLVEQVKVSKGDSSSTERQIADVVGLQAAQLILVSKEYQNAIEVITNNFQSIANDIRDISTLSSSFSHDEQNSETTLVKRIMNKLDEAIILLDQNDSNRILLEIQSAQTRIGKISNKATQTIFNQITELSSDFKNIKLDDENENSLNNQILKILTDIQNHNTNLNQKLKDIGDISGNMNKGSTDHDFGSDLEQEKIVLMVKISKILRSLDIDNNMLDTVLSQNSKLNKEILEKIESTINKVEYYMMFEEVLNDVISNLNTINKTLKPSGSGDSNDFSDLKEIQKLYTVKSERIIHGNITGESVAEEEEEDDLELF